MPINQMQRSKSCGALPGLFAQGIALSAANADAPNAGPFAEADTFVAHSPPQQNTRMRSNPPAGPAAPARNSTPSRNPTRAPFAAPQPPAQQPNTQAELQETLAQMRAMQAEMKETLAEIKTAQGDANTQLSNIQANSDKHAADVKQALDEKARLSQQRYLDSKGSWSKFVLKTCVSGLITTVIRHLPLILSMAIPVLTIDVAATIAGGPIGFGAIMGALLLVALGALVWQAYHAHREYRGLQAQDLLETTTASPDLPAATATDAGAATTGGSVNTAGAPTPSAPRPARRGWYRHCVDFGRYFFKRGIR